MGNAGEKGPVKKQGLEVPMVYFFTFSMLIALPLSCFMVMKNHFVFLPLHYIVTVSLEKKNKKEAGLVLLDP